MVMRFCNGGGGGGECIDVNEYRNHILVYIKQLFIITLLRFFLLPHPV
jgi:hypothetical protein